MYGKALSEISQKIGKPVVIHIKIDTGMGRLGFLWDEAHKTQTLQALEELCHLEGIYAQGVFTHFSCADCDEAFTTLQLERFQQVKEELEKFGVTIGKLRKSVDNLTDNGKLIGVLFTYGQKVFDLILGVFQKKNENKVVVTQKEDHVQKTENESKEA